MLPAQERSIVSSMAGTTRDAIDTDVSLPDGRAFKLVDTAGVRKRTAVAGSKDGAEVRCPALCCPVLCCAVLGCAVLCCAVLCWVGWGWARRMAINWYIDSVVCGHMYTQAF